MIICQCTGVTDRTIDGLIDEGVRTLEQITARCGAGRCCLPCREEICRLLAERAPAEIPPHAPPLQLAAVHG